MHVRIDQTGNNELPAAVHNSRTIGQFDILLRNATDTIVYDDDGPAGMENSGDRIEHCAALENERTLLGGINEMSTGAEQTNDDRQAIDATRDGNGKEAED
jgi:hypothetical protein